MIIQNKNLYIIEIFSTIGKLKLNIYDLDSVYYILYSKSFEEMIDSR